MNWTAVTQRLQGSLRDWVGVASNCTMGLFPGRHGCFLWLLQDGAGTWIQIRSPNAGIRGYAVTARPRIHFEHHNNMKNTLSLLVVS